jgi:ribosomal protein S18 acetylase RimI-like enzyme
MTDTVRLTFRVAGHHDIPVLETLVQSAYRGTASRDGWTTEADLLDGQRTDVAALAAIIDSPSGVIVIAQDIADVVACCQLEQRADHTAYIGMVAVRPRLQGAGHGRALLTEAERRAIEFGARRVRMTVISQRAELIAWYERLGYRRSGETEPFPYGDERFGLPRVDDLEFIVLEKPLAVA